MINKNARMLFSGRVSSTLGDSIYQVAVIWHIYYITNSTVYTGLATAFTMIPKTLNFLFGPWVEYSDKQKILKYSQFIQFLLMLMIPLAFYFKYENVRVILTVIFLISFIENIQGTSEISIVPSIMNNEDIPKYNSFLASTEEAIDMAMKGIFGFVILFISVEAIYVFNALTFLAAALFFTLIRYNFKQKKVRKFNVKNYKADLVEGFNYLFKPSLLFVCLPFLVSNLVAGIMISILPAFAEFKVDLNAYGMFLLAMSVGSLIGSLLSFKLSDLPLKSIMTFFPFLSFVFLLLAVVVTNGVVSILLFGLANLPIGAISVYFISYLQTSISPELLGRVSSIIDSFLVSTIPIGAFLAGMLSQVLPIHVLMVGSSLGMLFISIYFLFVKIEEKEAAEQAS
ncbi:MFS transporter [Halobacillus andaensis]|uniref:MFS transporter n=1 Tax=Halobacillus andaensis TaxID=1176239 RepID=A0A917B1K7_HALAA|nr:MFS transporter [Halobacillus andaensis]MBP2003973.1 hypothetical protein [Halobacillus andaensis]GGF14832.1 MFS transporter [Halobacillus andaensis]